MGILATMWNTALIGAAVAAGYWFLRGQSIHKGFGLTLHWWSLVDLLVGILITTLAMLGIFGVLWAFGAIDVVSVGADTKTLLAMLNTRAAGASMEEVISRAMQLPGLHITLGLVLALLARPWLGGTWESRMDRTLVWAVWPALVIISLVFGYIHISNAGATWFSAFSNTLGGMMYGIAFMAGKNLWLPIGMHFAWNYVQGHILGFAVSGGQGSSWLTLQITGPDLLTGGEFGPEGGVVAVAFRLVVIAAVLGYCWLRAVRRGSVARLDFPIAVYANPPRPRPVAVAGSATPAPTAG